MRQRADGTALDQRNSTVDNWHSRSLQRCNSNTGDIDEDAPPEDLVAPISTYLDEVGAERAHAFRCLAIAALVTDGVTTAATIVSEAIRDACATGHPARPRLVLLTGEPADGSPPKIFSLLPRRTLVRTARQAGLIRRVPGPRPWMTMLIIGAAIALSAAPTLAGSLAGKDRRPVVAAVLSSQTLLGTLILATAGVTSQVLLNRVAPGRRRRPPEQDIAERLAAATEQVHADFVQDLAAQLENQSGNGLRCLVVDDYSRLDRTTQQVLNHYLLHHVRDRQPELWVIFDGRDQRGRSILRQRLFKWRQDARRRRLPRPPYGLRRTTLYDMPPLPAAYRAELAERTGHPERVGFLTVKAIVSDREQTVASYLEQVAPHGLAAQDPDRHAALELLYLLSLTSVGGGGVEWRARRLRYKLAEQRRGRTQALRTILTGPGLTVSDLDRRLDRMRKDFTQVVAVSQVEAENYLSVSPEVGLYLQARTGSTGNWAALDLADPALGHLFWALYRFDHRHVAPEDAFWNGKLTGHLKRTALPTEFAARFGAEAPRIADQLMRALQYAIAANLRSGQLADVTDLLDRACRVVNGSPQHRSELFLLARDVYSVTGDDATLHLMLELLPDDPAEPPAGDESIGDSLPALFAQASTEPLRLSSTTPAFLPGGLLSDMRADIELRGTWLALSVQPFVFRDPAPLRRAVLRAHSAVAPLVRAAVAACVDEPAERGIAELAAVSIGLWCWALAGERERASAASALALEELAGSLIGTSADASGPEPEPASGPEPEPEPATPGDQDPTGRPEPDQDPTGRPEPDQDPTGSGSRDADLAPVSGPETTRPCLPVPLNVPVRHSTEDILDTLDTVYTIAGVLRLDRLGNDVPAAPDLTRDGMTEELLTVVVVAALVVRLRWSGLDTEQTRSLDGMLREGLDLLNLPVPRRFNSTGLAAVAGSLTEQMQLLEVTWKALGFDHLASTINIRRVQFMSLTMPGTAIRRNGDPNRGLVADRNRNDLLGLLANLAAAESLGAQELAAEVLSFGTLVALQANMGDELVTQLCMVSLRYAHAYRTRVTQIFRFLVGGSAADPSTARLTLLLDAVSDERMGNVSLWLANLAHRDGVDRDRVIALLRRRINTIRNPEAQANARDQVEARVLAHRVNGGEALDVDDVLDQWADRRDRPVYGYVLYILAQPVTTRQPLADRLRAEAYTVLIRCEDYLESTGVVLLAERLASVSNIDTDTDTAARTPVAAPAPEGHPDAEPSTDPLDVDLLVRTLRRGVEEHLDGLDVQVAIRALEFLATHDTTSPWDYRERLWDLRQRQLTLLYERELTRVAHSGRYAALFLKYWRIFHSYGLLAVNEPEPVGAPTRSGRRIRTAQDNGRQWLRDAPAIPFVELGGRRYLSARFLTNVEALFESDLRTDRDLDGVRQDFDDAAQEAIADLFALLNDLDGIPPRIRAILDLHRATVLSRGAPTQVDPTTLE